MRPPPLRILAFNTHEGTFYELAKTGHRFDVLLLPRGPWEPRWLTESRPVPANVTILGRADELDVRDLPHYDLILAQSLPEFELVEARPEPKILLAHTAFQPLPAGFPSREAYFDHVQLRARLRGVPIVYVSPYCARGWGLPGHIIRVGLDERDYADYP